MARRDVDIVLGARDRASAKMKNVGRAARTMAADVRKIGGVDVGPLVGAWTKLEAYAQTAKLAIAGLSVALSAAEGDWENVNLAMSRLPKGLGEVYSMFVMLGDAIMGVSTEIDGLNRRAAEMRGFRVKLGGLHAMQDRLRAEIELAGLSGQERQIAQARQRADALHRQLDKIAAKLGKHAQITPTRTLIERHFQAKYLEIVGGKGTAGAEGGGAGAGGPPPAMPTTSPTAGPAGVAASHARFLVGFRGGPQARLARDAERTRVAVERMAAGVEGLLAAQRETAANTREVRGRVVRAF